jgi:hypothetical protein
VCITQTVPLTRCEQCVPTSLRSVTTTRPQCKVVVLFCFRPQLLGHRQALLQQLTSSEDPALVLHLTTLILFQAVSQTMLHASGRFVSNILTYLQPHLLAQVFNTLQRYHGKSLLLFITVSILSGIRSVEACCRHNIIRSLYHCRSSPFFFSPCS